MFSLFKKRNAVVEAAAKHFVATEGGKVIRGMNYIVDQTENGFIVRICYGETCPPSRSWFFVSKDGLSVTRLSDEESQPYHGVWR
jgi:hypothetical protein